jgi:2-desacetyl-2-hydroxyethyl bacteriochlorophyllide A dehydrogenase
MRAAVYLAPETIEVEVLPSPVVAAADVVIVVEACGVCGSDVASYIHGHYVNPGQVMGHEMCGRVSAVGEHVTDVSLGDRVVVRPMRSCGECSYCLDGRTHLCSGTSGRSLGYGMPGGFAEQVLIRDAVVGRDLYVVPHSLDPRDAMWAEPLAVALHAVALVGVDHAVPLVVIGGGSVGLCIGAAAKACGYDDVTVVEPRPDRRSAARALGMRTADGSNNLPYQDALRVIDASGSPSAIRLAMRAMRPGGRIVLVGLGDAPVPWEAGRVNVVGSFAYTDDDFARSVDLLVKGSVQLGRVVTHVFALDETALALVMARDDPSVVKAVVMPSSTVVREGTT